MGVRGVKGVSVKGVICYLMTLETPFPEVFAL